MIQFLGACQMGFVYALLALGVYLTFRILNTPDLTADGSFTLGMAVCGVVSVAGQPLLGLLAAAVCGMLAGVLTGLMQTKGKIHPILAGILTMSGLYSVNMFIMGGTPNLAISKTLFKQAYALFPEITKLQRNLVTLGLAFLVCALLTGLLCWLFKTHIGLCIRAVGNNEDMVRASSINSDRVKILALGIANAYVAMAGAMSAQLQGFADVGAGIGMVVVGIASVIIGELLFGRRSVTLGLLSAVVGSVAYRLVYALAFSMSAFPAYALKLVSALIVVFALCVPVALRGLRRRMRKGASHA
ncbi:MAG: ABC transporter permease [Eubacteriales bacterium]|nr:ABC transporter permease [Eubacteriales bacterium]